ncbi:MAG: hypothetical protein K0R62_8543, partial [Nonomuraea muscovyensis]|nr:hypothetical protein [Nonomuraea muscovyensis]
MFRRMPITSAADRIIASLETKRLRRPWNPDLHPRDSKGRFIETGGIARLWGGGMARVLRSLGGRNVLVENLATRQRSTIHASRLTMVARPDGSRPTKSKRKVRDEDERRLADTRRGTGLEDDDPGDQGDTSDDPHDKDDQGEDIGEDIDGVDLGETEPEPDDDDPFVLQGRPFKDGEADSQNPETTRYEALPMPRPSSPAARHRAGQGSALRALGPKAKDDAERYRFADREHAQEASEELVSDYMKPLDQVWDDRWDNDDARKAYDALTDPSISIDEDTGKADKDEVDELIDLWEAAERLSTLADEDGKEDIAERAATLASALQLAWSRFRAHGSKPIPRPRKNSPARDAWRPIPIKGTVRKAPQPKPATSGKGGKRFANLNALQQHWQSSDLEPATSDKAAQQRHQKEIAGLFAKLETPQLSRKGTFIVAKMTVEKDGKPKTGYAVIVSGSGARLAMSERKGEAMEFANRLEVAQVGGKPFDWDSPGYHQRLESPEGQEMVRQAGEEAKKAFADKAAKKKQGAAAKHTPAPATPAPAAAQTPSNAAPGQPNPQVQAAQQIATTTGVPAQNIGVGHVGPNNNDGGTGGRVKQPTSDAELLDYWKNGGDPAFDEHRKKTLQSIASREGWKVKMSMHRGFAVIQKGPQEFEVVRAYDGRELGWHGEAGQRFGTLEDADRFAVQLSKRLEEPSSPGQRVDWWDPELARRNRARLTPWRKDFGARMDDIRGQFDIENGREDSPQAQKYRERQQEAQNQQQADNAPAESTAPAPAPNAQTAPQANPDGDFPAAGEEVNSPDGVGSVVAVNTDSGSVLVRAERGTRSHALKDVTRRDGTPFAGKRTDSPAAGRPAPAAPETGPQQQETPQAQPEPRDWS